jgi:hypothetical protein
MTEFCRQDRILRADPFLLFIDELSAVPGNAPSISLITRPSPRRLELLPTPDARVVGAGNPASKDRARYGRWPRRS